MKISITGNKYFVLNSGSTIVDELPTGCYDVCFNLEQGIWLNQREMISNKSLRVFGKNTGYRISKIFKTFDSRNRNLGILLSGEKGMGKSVFIKEFASTAAQKGYPIIVVSSKIPGIAAFIQSIEQPVVVIFDEFEKIYGDSDYDAESDQTQFLSLFDGVSFGKKLFLVAINGLAHISSYFINRPGRFYYHFKFGNLTAEDIQEYLEATLKSKDEDVISQIKNMTKLNNVNYDMLNALVSELNNGYSLKEAVSDLNIAFDEPLFYKLTMKVNGVELVGYKRFSFARTGEIDVTFYTQDRNGGEIEVDFKSLNGKIGKDNVFRMDPKQNISSVYLREDFGKYTKDWRDQHDANEIIDDISEITCELQDTPVYQFSSMLAE